MLGHTFQFLQPTNVKMTFFSFESSLSSVTGNNPWPLGSSLIQPASKLSASALGHSGETSLKITHHSNFPKNTPIKKILHPSPGIQKTRKSYQGCNWLYTNKQTYHHQEHPSPSNFPTWPSFPHPGPFPPPSLGVSKLLKSTIQHWKGHSACPFPSDVANLSYRSWWHDVGPKIASSFRPLCHNFWKDLWLVGRGKGEGCINGQVRILDMTWPMQCIFQGVGIFTHPAMPNYIKHH